MEDRPPPSPAKLLTQFNDWVSQTEMPGRTMSYLKTGFLPEVLAERDDDRSDAMLAAWQGWEEGTTTPTAVLESLRELGIADLLSELAG